VSSKYEFIDGEKASYPLLSMCRWLDVSRSGFYEWRGRPASATAQRRFWLAVQVRKAFKASRGTYGYRRVHVALARGGVEAGPELVRHLMARLGLVACQPRPWRTTTTAGPGPAPSDHLAGDFTSDAPGCRLVGDITYVRTWEGWLYLATVIDLCTKEVVGWSMADHMRTELICDAITMAHSHRDIARGAVFHSDRGCQYTSDEFARHLCRYRMVGSMGRTGVCWDNALAESFFASLKKELVYRTVFSTRKKAYDAIAEYIEVLYNRQRLHSGIGYRTPLEALTEHETRSAA
jgi:putative transposase